MMESILWIQDRIQEYMDGNVPVDVTFLEVGKTKM